MQTEIFKVTGMTCGSCTNKVTKALKAIPGVGDVHVSLSAGEASVRYDDQLTSPDQMKSAVQGAGYGIGLATTREDPETTGGCCCG